MMKKNILFLISVLLLTTALSIRAYADAGQPVVSKDQLNRKGIKIGVSEGSASMFIAEKELAEAELVYMDTMSGYEAVAQGKIDAYVYERMQMQLAIDNGLNGVRLLDENMNEKVAIANGISLRSSIPDLKSRMNEFIALIKEDGTLDDMYERWVIKKDYEMPVIESPSDPELHLVVGTTGIVPPYSYYSGTELTGFDIEMSYRFAAWLGADVEFKIYDYSGIISAAASGDVDCIIANLNVTPERAQAVPFSDILFEQDIGIMVRDEGSGSAAASSDPQFKEFSDLSGKRVSMLSGAPFEELVRSHVPDVGEFTYFSATADMILALKSGKTDAMLINNAVAQLAVNRNPDLAMFPHNLGESTFGMAFEKGSPELEKWQKAYDSIPEETIEELWQKWTGSDEEKKTMPEQDWPGENGSVTVATCDSLEPMSYMGEGGEILGFDNEILLLMAKELDVHVDFVAMEFSAVLTYVQSGKALIGTGSIVVTDERRESVDFVEYYPSAFVLAVRAMSPETESSGFAGRIKSSFDKTFIRENRWQLFARGILVTIFITAMSIILGTLLGFVLFMMTRDGNKALNKFMDVYSRVILGMPMVVLLMVLYYIIFGQVSISGIAVSVMGFTLAFAASVHGLLRLGVSAIDAGQHEAAYALGHSRDQTFFRIILPQALPLVMDSYKGEITGLIKGTAVVGYIAVQDLTKIGDIVRSRTYEAFFPLIAIALIYFILEWLFLMIVSVIQARLDPKRSSGRSLLKGVSVHDKD